MLEVTFQFGLNTKGVNSNTYHFCLDLYYILNARFFSAHWFCFDTFPSSSSDSLTSVSSSLLTIFAVYSLMRFSSKLTIDSAASPISMLSSKFTYSSAVILSVIPRFPQMLSCILLFFSEFVPLGSYQPWKSQPGLFATSPYSLLSAEPCPSRTVLVVLVIGPCQQDAVISWTLHSKQQFSNDWVTKEKFSPEGRW